MELRSACPHTGTEQPLARVGPPRVTGYRQFGDLRLAVLADDGPRPARPELAEAGNPLATNEGKVLLGLDVWEHSYYLDFRNRRPDYITNFLDKLANYEYAASQL